jgi:hypothetical protein
VSQGVPGRCKPVESLISRVATGMKNVGHSNRQSGHLELELQKEPDANQNWAAGGSATANPTFEGVGHPGATWLNLGHYRLIFAGALWAVALQQAPA